MAVTDEQLAAIMQARALIIMQVKENFADLFDNHVGGPFLEEISQQFDDARYNTFMLNTIDLINFRLATSGVVFDEMTFPYTDPLAAGVMRIGMVVHAIKHFKLSFVEYPDWSKVQTPSIDRRDYLNRWDVALKDWEKRFDDGCKALAASAAFAMASGGTQTLLDPESMVWGGGVRSYGGIVPPWWYQ